MRSPILLSLLAAGAAAHKDSGKFGIGSYSAAQLDGGESDSQSNVAMPPLNASSSLAILSIRGGDDEPFASNFFYAEVSSDDFAPEDDALNSEMDINQQPVVATSQVLYEGGCFVSSHPVGHDSILNGIVQQYFDSDDDDDEEDDDDDGHSSMLANSAIRRARLLSDGSYTNSMESQSSKKSASSDMYFASEIKMQRRLAAFISKQSGSRRKYLSPR